MTDFDTSYYENTYNAPPSDLLVHALRSCKSIAATALDLGCGAGRDTRLLLDENFTVTAIDIEQGASKYISQLPHQDRLNFVCSSFEEFQFQNYDLINARYALPFMKSEYFTAVFEKIKEALLPGGIFVGQFFGVDDEWNMPGSGMTFHTEREVKELLTGLKVLEYKETNEPGRLADGSTKHWHVFDIIAQNYQ